MRQTNERTPANAQVETATHRPVWWIEDPFGSIVTGMVAPAVAVAVLAAMIAVLASTY